MRDVRGKKENAPIYIEGLEWGQRSDSIHSVHDTWQNGDNEATSSIQRMTRGEAVGKGNRRNSVYDTWLAKTRVNEL